MEDYSCGSGGIWNILLDSSFDNVMISVNYWCYFQVGLCAMLDCFSTAMYLYFDLIEYL